MNKFVAKTTWSEVCRLSRGMTNGLSTREIEEQNPLMFYPYTGVNMNLVYMADDSIGYRDWIVEEEPADRRPSFNGEYLGFEESKSLKFIWGSATSAASITAKRDTDGSWIVTFQGNVNEAGGRPERESSYVKTFFAIDVTEYIEKTIAFPDLLMVA